jgi:hypothetical protein
MKPAKSLDAANSTKCKCKRCKHTSARDCVIWKCDCCAFEDILSAAKHGMKK